MESSQEKNEEIFKMKSDNISLKLEPDEATRIKEEVEKQLAKKNNDCERLEEEIVSHRKKVERMYKILKSAQAMDDMLSHQRSPFDKSGLGYEGESSNKNDNASNNKDVRKPRINVAAPSKGKGQVDIGRNPTPRRNADGVNDARINGHHQKIPSQKDFRSTSRKPSSP